MIDTSAWNRIEAKFKSFSPLMKKTFQVWLMHDYDYDMTAHKLGISPALARGRIGRIKRRLREARDGEP